MNINELKKHREEMHWDLTPEEVGQTYKISSLEDIKRIEKIKKSQVGYYFYIDVWNFQVRLAVMENFQDSGRSEIIDNP